MSFVRPLGLSLLLALGTGAVWAQATDFQGAFMRPERGTGSADVAVDAGGGLHMGFVHWEPSAEAGEALYGHCAGPAEACGDSAAWTAVELVPAARRVQVAATADGRPSLLIESEGAEGGTGHTYAECDAGCGDPANWRLALLATAQEDPMVAVFATYEAPRNFALDPEGRPQFVYSDRNYFVEPDHYGTFWTSCKANCSDPTQWVETDLARHVGYDTEVFDAPALAIDPEGRPRVALFAGAEMEVADLSHTLMYIWCDAGPECLVSDQPWFETVIATDAVGEGAALAMTPEGHPRMAFLNDGAELSYAWCGENRETEAGGAWDALWVENQASLSAERPTAIPFTCDAEL